MNASEDQPPDMEALARRARAIMEQLGAVVTDMTILLEEAAADAEQ